MHEVILVPVSSDPSKEFLQEAGVDVNRCQVNDEDYLSGDRKAFVPEILCNRYVCE